MTTTKPKQMDVRDKGESLCFGIAGWFQDGSSIPLGDAFLVDLFVA